MALKRGIITPVSIIGQAVYNRPEYPADKMSKLRCYERNYGREKLLQLVRIGREERKLGATGTEGISIKEIRLRDVLKEHSDAAKKYIDGFQASILGETVKKTFSIRNHLRLL